MTTTEKRQRFAIANHCTTTGYVIWSSNHLLQRRQFAYDGRYWFYQPGNRSPFQLVNPRDIPENTINAMAEYTGLSAATLRAEV